MHLKENLLSEIDFKKSNRNKKTARRRNSIFPKCLPNKCFSVMKFEFTLYHYRQIARTTKTKRFFSVFNKKNTQKHFKLILIIIIIKYISGIWIYFSFHFHQNVWKRMCFVVTSNWTQNFQYGTVMISFVHLFLETSSLFYFIVYRIYAKK